MRSKAFSSSETIFILSLIFDLSLTTNFKEPSSPLVITLIELTNATINLTYDKLLILAAKFIGDLKVIRVKSCFATFAMKKSTKTRLDPLFP